MRRQELRVSSSAGYAREIEIEGEKEFGSIKDSHDKEKLEQVFKRVANEGGMAALLR